MENIDLLLKELLSQPAETPYIEFKANNSTPQMIGEDISALANSAALYEKNFAYMIWGVEDITHQIIGTSFDFQTEKKEMKNWRTGLDACYPIMLIIAFTKYI